MILDSNIVIYSAMPEYNVVRNFLRKHENDLFISAITKLEVLGYHKLTEREQELFIIFFQNINILSINNQVINQAIKIRQTKSISIGDSIIAATALIHNQEIFTNNTSDFRFIEKIKIIEICKAF